MLTPSTLLSLRPRSDKPPRLVEELSGESCLKCGCKRIFVVQAFLESPDKNHFVSNYAGCAACGWQTRQMVTEDFDSIKV